MATCMQHLYMIPQARQSVLQAKVCYNVLLHKYLTGFQKECVIEDYFSDYSIKTYVVGTQKDRLNETVLLSTKTYV